MFSLTWLHVALIVGFCACFAAILTAFVLAWRRSRSPFE